MNVDPNAKDAGLDVRIRSTLQVAKYYARRALGKVLRKPSIKLSEVAYRSDVICPPGEIEALTPIIWEHHIPKILGADFGVTVDTIRAELRREKFQFEPVVAHRIRNAVLAGGSVFCGRYRHEIGGTPARWGHWPGSPTFEMDSASLAATPYGSRWFAHWMMDELPYQLLAAKFGPLVAHLRDRYVHESGYHRMLDIPQPLRLATIHFRDLVIVDEFAQNPHKTARYRVFRDKLASFPKGRDRIFLMRGNSGSRRILVNEQEVADRLAGEGFITINPTTMTAEDVVATCRGASMIISVEGSHMAPAHYLVRDWGTMIVLNPPCRTSLCMADINTFCGIRTGMFICDTVGDSKSDFQVDIDELMRFIDFVERKASQETGLLQEFVTQVLRQQA